MNRCRDISIWPRSPIDHTHNIHQQIKVWAKISGYMPMSMNNEQCYMKSILEAPRDIEIEEYREYKEWNQAYKDFTCVEEALEWNQFCRTSCCKFLWHRDKYRLPQSSLHKRKLGFRQNFLNVTIINTINNMWKSYKVLKTIRNRRSWIFCW